MIDEIIHNGREKERLEYTLDFYKKLERKLKLVQAGELEIEDWLSEVAEKIPKYSQELGDVMQKVSEYHDIIILGARGGKTAAMLQLMSQDPSVGFKENLGIPERFIQPLKFTAMPREELAVLVDDLKPTYQHREPPKRKKPFNSTNNRKKTKYRRK